MRALLVANPHATTTTAAGRDVIARAMAGEVKLDVLETERRGHAAEAAEQAVRDGIELVVAHGGDGTLNEVVNGVLAATDGRPGDRARRPGRRHRARRIGERVRPRARHAASTRWRRPRACWSRSDAGRAGWSASATPSRTGARRAGGSRSTRAWAGTPRSSRPSSGRGPRAGRPPRCATRRPPCASTSASGAGRTSMTVEIAGAAAGRRTCGWRSSAPPTPGRTSGSRAVRTNPGSVFGAGLGVFGLRDLGAGTVGVDAAPHPAHGRRSARPQRAAPGRGRPRPGARGRARRPAGGRRTPGRPPRCAVSCGNRCATCRRVRRTVSGPSGPVPSHARVTGPGHSPR